MLLLEHPMRLSTDIDILVEPGTDIDAYIHEASKILPFEKFEEQKRVGKNSILKKHYKFFYQSPMKKGDLFHIILDVIFEDNHYSSVVLKEINNELLIIKEPKTYVSVPNANCILGDKLTAFAPHTTGILLGVDKEMEIMKQMYDIFTLIDVIDDFTEVKETYKRFVQAEVAYRGQEITYEEVLKDTIRATACIISKGHSDKEEFPLYMYGANSLKSHIFNEKYSGELATIQACKVLCLAACVLVNAEQMIIINKPENYIDVKIPMKEYIKMAYMKKLKLEAYAYLVEGAKLMDIDPVETNGENKLA